MQESSSSQSILRQNSLDDFICMKISPHISFPKEFLNISKQQTLPHNIHWTA